jgi:glycosyltransferase involved in cell wall biosynthesis
MNILYIADSSSWHNAKWTEFFAKQGHKVILFSDNKPYYKEIFFHENIKIIESDPFIETKNRHLNKITSIVKYKHQIEKIIKEEDIEIIHCVALYYGFLSTFLKTDLPVIYTTQGSEILIRSQSSIFYKHMAKRTFDSVDIITNDSHLIQKAGIEIGAKKENNYIIQNGVDISIFNEKIENIRQVNLKVSDETLLIYSPRGFIPLYNIVDIIEALNLLKKENIDFKCMFAFAFGGEYLPKYKSLVAQYGLENNVIWNGYVNHSDMAKYYRSADVTLSVPSSDSSPKSVYESMACGTPVIVSDLPWTKEHLQEKVNVLKVKVNTPKMIKESILELYNNKPLRLELIKNGIQIAKDVFDYEANMSKMESIMLRTIKEGKL